MRGRQLFIHVTGTCGSTPTRNQDWRSPLGVSTRRATRPLPWLARHLFNDQCGLGVIVGVLIGCAFYTLRAFS